MPTQHVDVVNNDWLAGIQYPLATIALDDNGVVTVDPESGQWKELAEEIAQTPDPAKALDELQMRFHGSQLFATEPHSDDQCPFHGRPIYLDAEEASGSATPVGGGR
jgi:hypothetical protein